MPTDWQTLRWIGGPAGHLRLLDQTRLPVAVREVACHDVESLRGLCSPPEIQAALWHEACAIHEEELIIERGIVTPVDAPHIAAHLAQASLTPPP